MARKKQGFENTEVQVTRAISITPDGVGKPSEEFVTDLLKYAAEVGFPLQHERATIRANSYENGLFLIRIQFLNEPTYLLQLDNKYVSFETGDFHFKAKNHFSQTPFTITGDFFILLDEAG